MTMALRTRQRVRLLILSLNIMSHHAAAHILFSSPATAQDAVNKLHAHVFKGALLSVTLKKRLDSTAKQSHASTPMPSRANRLIVRNLPFDLTEQDLRAVFLPYGSIYSIHLPQNVDGHVKPGDGESSASPRGKGFAFVWMWHKKEAETAMTACNGMHVRAGLANDLIEDKQKKKKVRRDEKKQAEAKKAVDDLGRIIAVDWALSKNKWEEEKKHLDDEMGSEVPSEEGSDDTKSSLSAAHELGEQDDGEESAVDMDNGEEGEDVSDIEKARPSLPQPEAGTTLFVRNIPFLATEDELRTL
jgi:nucleolar protein 4